MSIRIGIVGVSGYGGSELLRLCSAHPGFEVAYVAADRSAGQKLADHLHRQLATERSATGRRGEPAGRFD